MFATCGACHFRPQQRQPATERLQKWFFLKKEEKPVICISGRKECDWWNFKNAFYSTNLFSLWTCVVVFVKWCWTQHTQYGILGLATNTWDLHDVVDGVVEPSSLSLQRRTMWWLWCNFSESYIQKTAHCFCLDEVYNAKLKRTLFIQLNVFCFLVSKNPME